MSAVPGWLDSARLPKAQTVVSALNRMARAVLDCSGPVIPPRQLTTK